MDEADLRRQIPDFIGQFFPWGRDGNPARPGPPAEQLKVARVWLNGQLEPFRNAALVLVARLQPVLDMLQQGVIRKEGERLVARLDMTHVSKSADGVLEKMVRAWRPPKVEIDFENFRERITDLGRFRIVANFVSDAQEIRDTLERAFKEDPNKLPDSLRLLRQEFRLEGHCLEDSFELPPGKRQKGERCFKGSFATTCLPSLKVEVQIVTILGEAWDKKDHFLIYEPRRRGVELSPEHQNEMFGMSELLYLADKTFDRLRGTILRGHTNATEGGDDASAQ